MSEENGLQEEQIDTDVLVIGAGAAGLMAAISAADCGAHVTLCEKGNARRSGGIPSGNDHFACYIPGIHKPSQRDKFIKDLLSKEAGDEDVVTRQVDLSYEVLKKWESWGINMKTNGHYEFVGHSWPGSSGKMGEPGKTDRIWLHFSDEHMCKKLEKQVRQRNVRIVNRVMVTDLLKNDRGRVVGAVGISTREPKLFIFRAKSIVFSRGELHNNRLYPPPYLIGYSMAHPATGDQVIIAYRAGADLQNAEIARRQISLRFGPYSGKGTWIGILKDSEGKSIAPPYLSEPDPELGDPATENHDAIDHVWATGKGPVWMDARGISNENVQYMKWGFKSESMNHFLRWLDQEKLDIRKNRFEFTTVQLRSHIQTRVDINFRTTVEGLYSVSTRNLSRVAVGGMIAGEAAAKDAQNNNLSDMETHRNKILQNKQKYEELLSREGQQFADWREAQWAILQIMHCYALPPHRTENTLMAGHNQLLRLREKSYQLLRADNQHDLYHCLEVLNLMDVAELVLLATNERKESRGQARRQDYPFTNPMLNDKLLIISLKDGKPVFRWDKTRRVSQ